MADDFDSKARAIARYVRNELENSGAITNVHDIRGALEAEGNLICKRCSNPVTIGDDRCAKCGARQAIDADGAFWKCEDCNMPISDPKTPKCPKCSGGKVRKAGPEGFECLRCGEGIADPKTTPVCPKCGEDRCVKRTHGHPARTVES